MTAILTTLLLALPAGSDDPSPKTRSHNLHSEILLTLHTNNIISEAIKKFGISNSTTSLLVVRWMVWSRGSWFRCRPWMEGNWSTGRRWTRYVERSSVRTELHNPHKRGMARPRVTCTDDRYTSCPS